MLKNGAVFQNGMLIVRSVVDLGRSSSPKDGFETFDHALEGTTPTRRGTAATSETYPGAGTSISGTANASFAIRTRL
jgi:hypothetical protein